MAEEERLPWLEAVEDEDAPAGISTAKMGTAIGVVLISAAAVAGTMYVVGTRGADDGAGAPMLIEAPDEPYKVRPADPGGLDIAGESETAFATSAGEDPDAALDEKGLKEAPRIAVGSPSPAPVEPKPAPKPATPKADATPAPNPQPAPAPTPSASASGPQVQLGSFTSMAQAEAAWVLLASNYRQVGAMRKSIQEARVNGTTYYRVRGIAADRAAAKAACAALVAAGEVCVVVN